MIARKWGAYRLVNVKAIAVERWLNDMPVEPGTRYQTKSVRSTLFRHAMRYAWTSTNPIRFVRQSTILVHGQIVLTLAEVSARLAELRSYGVRSRCSSSSSSSSLA